jgi:hypothetical protein
LRVPQARKEAEEREEAERVREVCALGGVPAAVFMMDEK